MNSTISTNDIISSSTALDQAFATDEPIEYLKLAFPNDRNPERTLRDIQMRVLAAKIDRPHRYELKDAIAKAGWTKLEFDIRVNEIITSEASFERELAKLSSKDVRYDDRYKRLIYDDIDEVSDAKLVMAGYVYGLEHEMD